MAGATPAGIAPGTVTCGPAMMARCRARRRPQPATDRVRVRRGAIRAEYDRAAIFEVLDAGLIAHVGVVTDDGPIVLPMAYGRTDEWLYVHGSVANAALRAAVGQDICITVTIVDGIVVGRSPVPQLDELPGRRRARHGPPGRRPRRAHGRAAPRQRPRRADVGDRRGAPSEQEIRQTMVIAVPLAEMSAKIRTGDPIDEAADLDGPHWAGHVPIRGRLGGAGRRSATSAAGIAVPAAIAALEGRPV